MALTAVLATTAIAAYLLACAPHAVSQVPRSLLSKGLRELEKLNPKWDWLVLAFAPDLE